MLFVCCSNNIDKPTRNLIEMHDEILMRFYLFHGGGEPIGNFKLAKFDDKSWAQDHKYVLLHHEAIETLQVQVKHIMPHTL